MTDPAPRLILLDLDGTLLGLDGLVSARNAAALARASDAGARVVIATARPIRWLTHLRSSIPATIAICSNGALVVDLDTGSVLATRPVDGVRLRALVERLRATGVRLHLGVEGPPEVGMLAEEHYPAADPSELRRAAFSELLAGTIIKAIIRADARDLPRIRQVVESDFPLDLWATRSSGEALLEISQAGVTKGSIVAGLAAEWGIAAADAIAFGDMPNDIEMMVWARRSVAVANADPTVAAIATERGAHHDDHAVARVLERWF